MYTDLTKLRNIGISAHIDSGKTTLTERVLFYTKRIHAIHEVKGKDGVGATMDSMDLERERGITIQSAATHCTWKGMNINIIDTPGHVDFTIEVERALRVLDGAILVLDSVAGVQSQTLTVDRQMRRYKVPRLVFVNKCDRQGANPIRAMELVRDKLGLNAVMLQVPVGLEDKHEGVVDLVTMRCHRFTGDNGTEISDEEIPADILPLAKEHREKLLDAASLFSDELMEAVLEERATPELVRAAVRKGTIALQLVPVFLGSAYKNKAVQKLLDGVIDYLPEPTQVENEILDLDKEEAKSVLPCDTKGPLVMLAFKLEDGRYGQLTYMRIYSGQLRKDDFITNTRTGKKVKCGRLVRMHSDQMEDIADAGAGDIVATFGIDCNTGETFTDGTVNYSMTSMHVPAAVISYSIKPKDSKSENNLSKALRRFSKEDPTFRVHQDEESAETIISGMGELHLDVYIERMKREYQVEVIPSPPRVAYRETITLKVDYNYTHKKQTGGSGQYGNVSGWIEPHPEGTDFEFVDEVVGGSVPRQFITSVEKGFKSMLDKGRLIGAPVVGVRVGLNDGKSHAVDSSDIAFQEAARGAWREAYDKAKPKILEPIMKVAVEGPSEFSGAILGTINQRRGMIVGSMDEGNNTKVEAEVPLSEMFGYSTVIRSSTQGKAEFTMEFAKYAQVPSSVGEDLIRKYQEELEKKRK